MVMIGSRLRLYKYIKKRILRVRLNKAIKEANRLNEKTKKRYIVLRFELGFNVLSVQDIKNAKQQGIAMYKFKSYPINKIIESAVYDTNNKNVKK